MADDIQASASMDSSGWKSGLSEAQAAAARFVAFMETLNSKLEAVSAGTISVADAMASIGAVGGAVALELETLAAKGQTVAELQSKLGMGTNEMLTAVSRILDGNAKQVRGMEILGDAYEKETLKVEKYIKAKERLASMEKQLAARAAANAAVVGAGTASVAPTRSRRRAASLYESTDPMDYESVRDLQVARKLQKLKQFADKNQLPFQAPDILAADDKHSLNIARLNYAYQQLRDRVKETSDAEARLSREAREAFTWISRKAAEQIRLAKAQHAAQEKLIAQQQRLRATAVRRELDSMFLSGPSSGRAAQLKAAGVIKAYGDISQAAKSSHGWTGKLFTRFEQGSAVAVKGTMALVRGLNSAQSAMAFMTSGFTGLLAMIAGATIGGFFKMAMDFEKSMTRVNLLVKKGESDPSTLTAQVKEISRLFGTGATETSNAFRIAISSDIPPEEIMAFMKQAEKLAVTHSASIEKTTDLLSMLRNAFSLTIGEMSHLRDMIFVMTDRGRTEVEQFSAEIGKIAPTARLAGANIQEMMAAFAALSRTRSTEQAGTLLRNLFKNIIEPSKDARTQLMKISLGLTPVQVKAQGLMETIRKFREEIQKNPQALNDVAEDLRELSAWGELTDSQFAALNSTFKEMSESVGLADNKFNEMADTTAVRWSRLTAQMKISAMEMISGVIESFAGITQGMGGVEIAQKKIESMFKRIELAVRYFLSAVQFVGTMAGVAFGAIATSLVTIWGLLKNIGNFASRAVDQVKIRTLTSQMEALNQQVVELKQTEDLGTGHPKVQAIYKQLDEKQKLLDEYMRELGQSEEDINTTISDMMSRIDSSWKPMGAMADAFVANGKRAGELAQEIADLNYVLEIMELDARQAALASGTLGAKVGKAQEEIRDKTAATAEALRATTEMTVKLGKDALKAWLTDNRDTIQGVMAGYRKLAVEQKSLVKELQKNIKDLIKDQLAFDDAMSESIEKIKDADRTPEQKINRLKERGGEMERRANEAAKSGDRDEVQRLLQQAMGFYESILNVSDTKSNRKVVVEALTRLKNGMDEVYKSEKASLEEKIATAEANADKFNNAANTVEANFRAMEQGIREVTREIELLGKAPTQATLDTLKAKIAALISSSDFFVNIQADPALSTLDKMIDKAKEFGAEMRAAFDIGARVGMDFDLKRPFVSELATEPGFIPMNSSVNRSNTTIHNRITNVDAIHVDAGGSDGPKKVDARRLARDIKRHIERGEAPALTRRK